MQHLLTTHLITATPKAPDTKAAELLVQGDVPTPKGLGFSDIIGIVPAHGRAGENAEATNAQDLLATAEQSAEAGPNSEDDSQMAGMEDDLPLSSEPHDILPPKLGSSGFELPNPPAAQRPFGLSANPQPPLPSTAMPPDTVPATAPTPPSPAPQHAAAQLALNWDGAPGAEPVRPDRPVTVNDGSLRAIIRAQPVTGEPPWSANPTTNTPVDPDRHGAAVPVNTQPTPAIPGLSETVALTGIRPTPETPARPLDVPAAPLTAASAKRALQQPTDPETPLTPASLPPRSAVAPALPETTSNPAQPANTAQPQHPAWPERTVATPPAGAPGRDVATEAARGSNAVFLRSAGSPPEEHARPDIKARPVGPGVQTAVAAPPLTASTAVVARPDPVPEPAMLDDTPIGELRFGPDMAQATRSATPMAFARPEIPRHMAMQLAEAAQRAGSGRATELMLNPAELGRVKISLNSNEGAVMVHVVADRPETLDLMRRHAEMLAQEFHSIGYGQAQFSFSHNGARDGTPARPDSATPGPQDLPDAASPNAIHGATTPALLISDRVDIRI